MGRLSSNHNLYNTCLNILRQEGFCVSLYRETESVELQDCLWSAQYGEFDFLAENPIGLLGLAKIFQMRNSGSTDAYWWVNESDDDVYEELVDQTFSEDLDDE